MVLKMVSFLAIVLWLLFIHKSHQLPPEMPQNQRGSKAAQKEILSQQESPLENRLKKLLNTSAHADVKFLVGKGGGQRFFLAHKNVLAVSSNVFKEMIDSTSANKKHKKGEEESGEEFIVFEVPDVEMGTFITMLRFIYTGQLSGVNVDNAKTVRGTAKTYGINGLVKACDALPNDMLYNSLFLNEKDLAQQYLGSIDHNVGKLMQSNAFLLISQKLLIEILVRDELVVEDELSIWKMALRWAGEQCDESGIECTAENRRQMLGPALYKIRFPLIPQPDFEYIAALGVLSSKEVISVYQYNGHQKYLCALPTGAIGPMKGGGHQQKCQLPFSTQNRNYTKMKGWITFTIPHISTFQNDNNNTWRYSNAVQIRGLPWKIAAQRTNNYMGLFLNCDTNEEWSCGCSLKLIIVSQKKEKEHLTIMFPKRAVCTKSQKYWGRPELITFQDLMDPENGWHNKKEDSVTVVADFLLEKPISVKKV